MKCVVDFGHYSILTLEYWRSPSLILWQDLLSFDVSMQAPSLLMDDLDVPLSANTFSALLTPWYSNAETMAWTPHVDCIYDFLILRSSRRLIGAHRRLEISTAPRSRISFSLSPKMSMGMAFSFHSCWLYMLVLIFWHSACGSPLFTKSQQSSSLCQTYANCFSQ